MPLTVHHGCTVVWEYFALQNFQVLIFLVEKFLYKWTYGTKNCQSTIIVRGTFNWLQIEIVKHHLLLSLCFLSFLPNKLSLWREWLTCWHSDLAFSKSTGLLLSRRGDISLYWLGPLGYTYKRKERVLVVCLPASISKLYWQILSEWYLLLVLAAFLVAVFGSLRDLAIGQGNCLWW